MKPIVPILVIVSALWILGGSYYLANTSCGADLTTLAPLSISDGELDFTTTSPQHFSFLPSSTDLVVEDQAEKSFSAVVKHLQQHPERMLNLTGSYLEEESNNSPHANLGIARAEKVKSFLLRMDADLADRIKTSSQVKNGMYSINGRQIDGVQFDFSAMPPSTSEIIDDLFEEEDQNSVGGTAPTLTLYGEDAIRKLKMDINLQQQIDNMRSTLDLNPGAKIIVTGHAEASRVSSKSKDKALIWAKNVRRFFRNNGIRSKEIKARTKGAEEPLVAPESVEAETKNNRVTVEIVLPE